MEPANDEFTGIEFTCPQCGTALDRYHEQCPQCGCALDEEFSATYRPPPAPPAVKVVAWLLLAGVVLIPLGLALWYLLL
jgi:predicted amidophosphoribosyltransferase